MAPTPLQQPRIPIWLAAGWPRRAPLRRAARYDGVYLMSVNQTTGEDLTPAEVGEAAAYLREQLRQPSQGQGVGKGATPFDIACNPPASDSAAQAAEHAARFEQAGATWLIEFDRSDSFSSYREVIRRGPPRP